MEEKPRFGNEKDDHLDHDSDTPEEVTPTRKLKRWRGSEGYWSRLFSESSTNEESNKDKPKDHEDEEDDEEDNAPGFIKRYKRFRRLRPGFRKQVLDVERQKIPEESIDTPTLGIDDPETLTPQSHETTPTEPDTTILPSVEAVDYTETDPLHSSESAVEVEDEETLPDLEYSVADSEAASPVFEATPEPESIETILRRRAIDTSSAFVPHFAEVVEMPSKEIRTEIVKPNIGLDLLNYALARRRDTKNMNKVKKEFKQVNSKIEEIEKLKQKLPEKTMINKQHDIVTPPIAIENRQSEYRENIPRIIENVVEKTTEISNKTIEKQNLTEHGNVYELQKPTQTPEFNMQPAGQGNDIERQKFMQEMSAAAELKSKIESEMQFERRHEVMDSQGNQRIINNQGSYDGYSEASSVGQNLYSQQSKSENLSSDVNEKDKGDYRQAAVSGVWGAVVGVVIFVMFYILTNR